MEVLLAHPDATERAAEVVRRHIEPNAEVTAWPAEATVVFRTAKSEEELAGLLAGLVSAGLEVTQFREVQTDLEEAFMTLARSARAETDGAEPDAASVSPRPEPRQETAP